jgi:L-2,4-diaminobutyrate decarboxylase
LWLVHNFDKQAEQLAKQVVDYSLWRLQNDPPLDGPLSVTELRTLVGGTITEQGIGGEAALQVFKDVLAPACISTDHPRYLSFIPSAPTISSNLFDLVVGASSLYGGSWLEGAGAVYAENQALEWLIDLANMPSTSGGVFVQGGTIGNLSALVAARYQAHKKYPQIDKWVLACSTESHSSIKSAADVMGVELLEIALNQELKLTGTQAKTTIDNFHAANPEKKVFAVVATAGTTNLGIIDELKSIGEYCRDSQIWFHIDGAYGLAALCADSVKHLFDGVELCDSFIVDPHKWLFAPFDACALIYKDPAIARAAHAQKAGYLELFEETTEFNPSDYAIQLTRRARGLPFWFSLATHGTRAYSQAMEKTIDTARAAAKLIQSRDDLELVVESELSIVAFKKLGWAKSDYQRWSDRLLTNQIGFVVPSTHQGEPILRFAIVNPLTSIADITAILDTLD